MRILFVAKSNSPHTARWIRQLSGLGWDVHLFPMENPDLVHQEMRGLTVYTESGYPKRLADRTVRIKAIWPWVRGGPLLARYAPKIWCLITGTRLETLIKVIQDLKPDIIHSLNLQDEGYSVLTAKQKLGQDFTATWICTTWGSDLYYFGRFPEHRSRITQVLTACDFLLTDCQRDERLARQYGFKGEFLGVFPGPGGFAIEDMLPYRQPGLPHQRQRIIVKGYQDWPGRALTALEGIRRVADLVRPYRIDIYSVSTDDVRQSIDRLRKEDNLNIQIIPQSAQEDLWKAMGVAKIAIAMNITDGIPNAMLEAMILGALPIQSDTVSTGEYINSGHNGFLINPEDPEAVAAAVRQALTDDDFVDKAAETNLALTRERIDQSVILPKILALYKHVASQRHE